MFPMVMMLVIGVCGYLVWLALKEEVVKEKVMRDTRDQDIRESTEAIKDKLRERLAKMKEKEEKGGD